MEITLAYGTGRLPVEVPPEPTTVVQPLFRKGVKAPRDAIHALLRSPIASPPLRDLVKKATAGRRSTRVAISVCDITRAQPRTLVIPAVLDELEGLVRPDDVVIIVATGTHRSNTADELTWMLGAEIVSCYQVVNHDARDHSCLADLGVVANGVPAVLNRTWTEADLRISTGLVEPHFFAGVSGGLKMVAPGLAGLETVLALHDSRRIASPKATWGVIEGNPVQDGLRAVARLSPPHFSVDVVLNSRQEITGVFAGETSAMHNAACAAVRTTAMRPVAEPFDIVVTSNSGYPLDQNLYQAVKGMSAAAEIVKPGGKILCAAECRDGMPASGNFAKLLSCVSSPSELLAKLDAQTKVLPDQWQAQIQARVQSKAHVAVKSDYLSTAQLRAVHLDSVDDIGVAVMEELAARGKAATVCVLPEGPQTIPYVRS